MPTEILTETQRQAYGHFNGDPTPEQLTRYCYLAPADRTFILARRSPPVMQLGFAVQVMTVRFLGTFVEDLFQVPASVVAFAAEQLDLAPHVTLAPYARSRSRFEHRQQICTHYGYRDFERPEQQWALMRFLYARAWYVPERPEVLFDLATLWLVERRILLPGVTVLERCVGRVVEQASERLWQRLAKKLTAAQTSQLNGLLAIGPELPYSNLDVLQRPLLRQSGPGLAEALQRYSRLHALGMRDIDLSAFPAPRLRALAQQAVGRSPSTLQRWSAHHRLAVLLAFAWVYEIRALDDALDLFDVVMALITKNSEQARQQWLVDSRKDLDSAALHLADAADILIDPTIRAVSVRRQAYDTLGHDLIQQAILTVRALACGPEARLREEMVERYGQIRLFLPTLLRTIDFRANRGGQAALASIQFIHDHLSKLARADFSGAPQEEISPKWAKRLETARGGVDGRAYVVWATAGLRDGLRRHDIYVPRSERWGNAQMDLIQPEEWQTLRPQVCRALDLPTSGAVELARQSEALNQAYREVAAGFSMNPLARIEKGELIVSPLDAQEEPESLIRAPAQVRALLPWVELLELVLEVAIRTGFTQDFAPLHPAQARPDSELTLSLCAVLVAEASNVPLSTIARDDHPALQLDRLAFVQQNYVRQETIAQANQRLVGAQSALRLAQVWGGGLVASVDGLRFVVPVKSSNALPNRKYFGAGRGITLFGLTSDQFTGPHDIIVPGAIRDSWYILECLLDLPITLHPAEIMSDTASYTDIVFGLFKLLGYLFSPHLADLGDRRFWRTDRAADYGALNAISRNVINPNYMEHWDDMLRVAGSLKLARVRPTQLMHLLHGGGRTSALGKAIGDYGRLAKSQHMLRFISSEAYQRHIRIQLNRGEGRNGLGRAIFHGRRGEVYQGYPLGQAEVLGALGFVANAVVLWNTIYMDAALTHLARTGSPVSEADQERLSPLGYAHINFHGRFSFDLPDIVQQGQLRPLRTPRPTDPIRFAFT